MYTAVVTSIKNVRPHSNANQVKLATCLGNQVVIGLEHQENELGVYFPCDGQLSIEFCHQNNLFRKPELNINKDTKPGMFDDNRRVRAQKFRGEISDGFWVPLSLFNKFIPSNWKWVEGYEFTSINEIEICNKYLTQKTINMAANAKKTNKTAKSSIMFKEHFDTEHFGKSVNKLNVGDRIIITEKLHGTSGRIGYVLTERKPTWKDKLAQFFGVKIQENEWNYLNGTRRVVLEESSGTQFHDPTIRDYAFNLLKGNLHKGETIFFEIVGYEPSGTPIMPSVSTKELKDKDFTKLYGENMFYSYGCEIGKCEIYVYRITQTNEDGKSIDLNWDDIVKRCGEIGVKTVPFITDIYIYEKDIENNYDFITEIVEHYAKGYSLLDVKHIREGVCVRVDNSGLNPLVMKHKSFEFKVLEGIIKDTGIVDMEEAQSY